MRNPTWTWLDYFPIIFKYYARVFIGQIRYFKFYNILSKNKSYYNKYFNEEVIIIGNGPSLLDVDKNIFNEKKVIVMNNFDRCEWKDSLNIVAHCVGEPFNSPSFFDHSNVFNSVNSETYWVDISTHGKLKSLDIDKKIFYTYPIYYPRIWGNAKVKLYKPTMSYQTTAILSIMVAIHMGFKNIKLAGFDHDWLANKDYSKHFYSSQKDKYDNLYENSYSQIIKFVSYMWDGYYALSETAKNNDIKIINITQDSFLDVFPFQNNDK